MSVFKVLGFEPRDMQALTQVVHPENVLSGTWEELEEVRPDEEIWIVHGKCYVAFKRHLDHALKSTTIQLKQCLKHVVEFIPPRWSCRHRKSCSGLEIDDLHPQLQSLMVVLLRSFNDSAPFLSHLEACPDGYGLHFIKRGRVIPREWFIEQAWDTPWRRNLDELPISEGDKSHLRRCSHCMQVFRDILYFREGDIFKDRCGEYGLSRLERLEWLQEIPAVPYGTAHLQVCERCRELLPEEARSSVRKGEISPYQADYRLSSLELSLDLPPV